MPRALPEPKNGERHVWTIIAPDGTTFTADADSAILRQPMLEIADCNDPQAPLEWVPDGPLRFSAALNLAPMTDATEKDAGPSRAE